MASRVAPDGGARQRWRLVVAYHGGAFAGWQLQPGVRTVQGALESAAERLLGEAVRVAGSGRTDAGVHAEAQLAAFSTTVHRSARAVRDGLNAHLGPDVACVDARPVPEAYDPRRWVVRKTYRYTWLDRPARDPLRHDRVWHVRHRLDVTAMAEAAAHLVGVHDFTSFRAAGCQAATPVRTLEGARVWREGDTVSVALVGNGFLRHMVRIVAGTLEEVGAGRRTPAAFRDAIVRRDRRAAGRTAPAQGLTLVAVEDGDGPNQHHGG